MADELRDGDAGFARGRPRFSVIIPAWNEEKFLPRLLDSIDAARKQWAESRWRVDSRVRGNDEAGGNDGVGELDFRLRGNDGGGLRNAGAGIETDDIEVIVADNASTDRTAEIARARGCRVAHVEKRLIAASRNGGAKIARGELLCFVDADYRIHPDTFEHIDRVMSARHAGGAFRHVGGGTGLVLERRSFALRITEFAIIPMLLALRIDGGVWFMRRPDFDEVGGYDETQLISEDVRILWALRKLGKSRRPRQKLATRFDAKKVGMPGGPALAICSTRKFDKHGDWHFLRDFYKAPFLYLFSKRRFERYAREYWYEDER